MKKRFLATAALLLAPWAHASAPCTNGDADGFACSHVDLLGRLSISEMGGGSQERLNDIWGWTDPDNGEEYAIVGMSDGTAFVRLPPDGPPVFLGRLASSDGRSPIAKPREESHGVKSCMHDDGCGEASSWRDMKVFGNHVFVVSEAAGFGMQVFDLTKLRSVSSVQSWGQADETAHYPGVGHSHNIFINEESARAYIVGAGPPRSTTAGGLHVLDIEDPANPVFLAEINEDGYTHDVQCVMYRGPDSGFSDMDEICFASNEDTLTVWEVNDPADAEMLSRVSYSGVGYVHQGWLSEDQRYFFVNDELDEVNSGTRTRLRIFDVSDLRNPELAAEYLAPTLAIDHNNYVHGRWLLQSNYSAGLRILDILDPLRPVEAAYFDTVAGDATDFVGVWSNYRFPGSGRIVLSDIHGGLFVVEPTLQDFGTAPDITVALDVSTDSAVADESVEASVTVSNGDAVAVEEVLLTVHLPRNAAFSTVQAPGSWNCSAPARVIECRIAEMAAGSEHAFTFAFSASGSGSKQVIAMAYGLQADASPADNLDQKSITIAAPVGEAPAKKGGGSLAWLCLLLLALTTAARARKLIHV